MPQADLSHRSAIVRLSSHCPLPWPAIPGPFASGALPGQAAPLKRNSGNVYPRGSWSLLHSWIAHSLPMFQAVRSSILRNSPFTNVSVRCSYILKNSPFYQCVRAPSPILQNSPFTNASQRPPIESSKSRSLPMSCDARWSRLQKLNVYQCVPETNRRSTQSFSMLYDLRRTRKPVPVATCLARNTRYG